MKKIVKYILTLLFLGGLGWSCSEDFLEVYPTEFLSAEQLAAASENNPELLAGSLNGIYTLMFEAGTGGTTGHDDFGQKGYDIYGDMLCGDMALSVSTYGWYRTITQFQTTTDFTFQDNYQVWRYYYRIVRSANLVIDAGGGNDAIPELDENKHILGQAKALRAYAYFYLTQYFQEAYDPGEAILPIYTNPGDPNQPKSTAGEVYALIEKDLNDAISLLETFSRTQKNQVNKSVAQAFLAYTYAVTGEYGKAKDLTADIINNGGYTLMSAEEVLGGFTDVNTPGWMWGHDVVLDNGLDLISWWGQMDVYTYSYAWAGDYKAIDADLFAAIPANDVRKGQFLNNPASGRNLQPIYKFYDLDRVIGGQRNIETDYVYMRVAEMYLLHAETAAKSGDEGAAKTVLKMLLDQRMDDTSFVDGLSGQALLNEIYFQTRVELWGEGKSYLAMKRFKATTKRGPNHYSNIGESISYDDDRMTFEIPQLEIQNNPFID